MIINAVNRGKGVMVAAATGITAEKKRSSNMNDFHEIFQLDTIDNDTAWKTNITQDRCYTSRYTYMVFCNLSGYM